MPLNIWGRDLSQWGMQISLCHIFPSGHCSHNSLTWLSDTPVWVDQWPLKGERLEQTCLLVKQQLEAGHIEQPLKYAYFCCTKEICQMEAYS